MSQLADNLYRPSLLEHPDPTVTRPVGRAGESAGRGNGFPTIRRFTMGFLLTGLVCAFGLTAFTESGLSNLIADDSANVLSASPEAVTATLNLIRAENEADEATASNSIGLHPEPETANADMKP